MDFGENPENIYKIIKYSYDKGVRAIQVIPEKPMINALKIVKEENLDISIYGTIRKNNINKDNSELCKALLDKEKIIPESIQNMLTYEKISQISVK